MEKRWFPRLLGRYEFWVFVLLLAVYWFIFSENRAANLMGQN
jgi:hypothetical protein